MSDQNRKHVSEETVVPVANPLAGREPGRRLESAASSRRQSLVTAAVAVVLVGLVVAVFFALPRWVDQRAERRAQPEPVAAEPEAPAAPALTAEEVAALEAEAESLLADLLEQQNALAARSASSWGGDTWTRYEAESRAGDAAFLVDDFAAARDRYAEAVELGSALLARGDEIMESALAAGDAAVAAGNAALAVEQFDIVLGVDPDHERARAGRARAERLPEVLERVRAGDRARQAEDLTAAAEAYRAALDIDPEWTPAERALAEVNAALAASRFDRLLSQGFAALAEEDYSAAETAFRGALGIRPRSQSALDGLEQAEQGAKLDAIALAEVRALAFERRELWNQAIARYEAALATDSSLEFAIRGLERAQSRADLDRKLQNLIDHPNLLLTDSVLADAEALLAEAAPFTESGERISAQVDRLAALVEAASTPIPVELKSDQQTEVTLYRVGELGAFTSKVVELRPGTYTAVGSRSGFRDVRASFTVLPGRQIEPVRIVCVEPI